MSAGMAKTLLPVSDEMFAATASSLEFVRVQIATWAPSRARAFDGFAGARDQRQFAFESKVRGFLRLGQLGSYTHQIR